MAVAVSLQLVGPVSPQSVQVTVTGLTAGQVVTVTATAAGQSRAVRGGDQAVVTGTQLILTDVATPVNTSIVYAVTVNGAASASATVTVDFDGQYALQSVDGRTVIPFDWQDNDDPRQMLMRSASFGVPGRNDPVVRWDVSGGESGQLEIITDPPATRALRDHLRNRGPVMIVRTDGLMRDLEPVEYIVIRSASRSLLGELEGIKRVWLLGFEVIRDPEPGTVVAASTWPDFDAAYAASTWATFDAEWAGSSWDDFDRVDWANR